MVATIMLADPYPPPQPLGMGSVGQNSTFSEHGHVTYQIKGNHGMQQHGSKYFVHRPLPEPLLLGSKFTFFRALSCCISNLRESQM